MKRDRSGKAAAWREDEVRRRKGDVGRLTWVLCSSCAGGGGQAGRGKGREKKQKGRLAFKAPFKVNCPHKPAEVHACKVQEKPGYEGKNKLFTPSKENHPKTRS